MGTKSKNLNFNIFAEDDYVNFDDINHNFNILDGLGLCVEAGSQDVSRSGASATWRYKKFLNNESTPKYTVEASCAVIGDTSWGCTEDLTKGRQVCFASRLIKIPLPAIVQSANIYDVQTNVRVSSYTSESLAAVNWIALDKDIDNFISFRVISPMPETTQISKLAYINVKATAV